MVDNNTKGVKLKIEDSDMVENIPVELIQRGINITDKEEKENKIIFLEEIQGNMFSGKKLKITAKGLEGGLANTQDGIAFFGSSTKKDGKFINDFILNLDSNYFPEMKEPTIFVIYFRRDTGKYYIKTIDENKEKYLIFILLDTPFCIQGENNLFSIFDYNFRASIDFNTKKLTLFYGQGNNNEKAEFKKEKGLIKIGRKNECDIVLNDTGISREHCIIYFDNDSKNWYIKDGNKENLSAGGTWLFVENYFPINNDLKIKLGPSLLNLELVNNS